MDSSIPCISISYAPNEPVKSVEPISPFAAHLPEEPDSPRPLHLLPPPAMSPNQLLQRDSQLSPLSPPHPNGGKGLERARFEAMLQASKERSAMVGAKKPLELRKEIAVKTQKFKQLERRALFLNKLAAPPSPSAAELPVTPPDSPAIFHFTLPSPGLESPLELFENVLDHPELYENTKRVEKVDFRLSHRGLAGSCYRQCPSDPAKNRAGLLPSLDQISQRMNKRPVSFTISPSPSAEQGARRNSRLPPFLRSRSLSPSADDQPPKSPMPGALRVATPPGRLTIGTPLPLGSALPKLPPSPTSPRHANPGNTTMYLPVRSELLPTVRHFGAENLEAACNATSSTVTDDRQISSRRAQVTRDMFNKLSRRTSGLPNAAVYGIKARDDLSLALSTGGTEDKQRRRISAPAEMPAAQRGARHPVLAQRGGF